MFLSITFASMFDELNRDDITTFITKMKNVMFFFYVTLPLCPGSDLRTGLYSF